MELEKTSQPFGELGSFAQQRSISLTDPAWGLKYEGLSIRKKTVEVKVMERKWKASMDSAGKKIDPLKRSLRSWTLMTEKRA